MPPEGPPINKPFISPLLLKPILSIISDIFIPKGISLTQGLLTNPVKDIILVPLELFIPKEAYSFPE